MINFALLSSSFTNLLNWLDEQDRLLFLKINRQWTNSLLDSVYPWWREATAWVPLYLFFIVFALFNFGKKALPWIFFAIVTLVITDQLSSTVIKHWVQRLRPCNDPYMVTQVRLLLDHCGSGYSFTSSHATNHFGFAMYVFMTTRAISGKWGWLMFVWAATIAYGQVYVGVHYPIDVFCGSLLGCLAGYLTATFFNKKSGLADIGNPQSGLA